MRKTQRRGVFPGTLCMAALAGLSVVYLAGCGTVRETLPPRSAMEQLLISTAADRAVEMMPEEPFTGKGVFVDVSNLECYDKPYVLQRIKEAVAENGGRLVQSPKDADVVLEVASGGLSVNRREYLLGIPELPLMIPGAGGVKTPELAIFKVVSYKGKAKLLFSALSPTTRSQLAEVPVCYGKSSDSFWWFLFVGPFERSDLPEELK